MMHEDEQYSAPQLRSLGSVEEMTNQELDKVGSIDDFLTLLLPDLDGVIQPD
jgi:hypothetical protein